MLAVLKPSMLSLVGTANRQGNAPPFLSYRRLTERRKEPSAHLNDELVIV